MFSTDLRCPQCSQQYVRRSHRQGHLERVLSLAYIYPFRCQLCTRRFKALQFGRRYTREAVDRREYDRVQISGQAAIWKEGESGEAVVTSLSMDGCGLAMDPAGPSLRLEIGTVVGLDLALPGAQVSIHVQGAVVRNHHGGTVGLQFLQVDFDNRGRLQEFVRSLISRR